jgi:excinuclease UvrABC nuclease subunit
MREVVYRRYRRLLEGINGTARLQSVNADLAGPGPGGPGAVGLGFSPDIPDASSAGALAPAVSSSETRPVLAPESESRHSKEPKNLPSLILIDGGLGQLHAAAEALESLGLTSQPLASIAKREEVIYLYGNEDEPIVLDRRSPVLHLIQLIRDESHRFAVGYHRQRRAMRDRDSELLNVPGVGPQTRQRLLSHFGSLRDVQQATAESLASVVPRKTAETIYNHFHQSQPAS